MQPVYLKSALGPKKVILPIIVSWKYKWPFGIASCGFALWVYGSINRLFPLQPSLSTLTFLDDRIPFLPKTVWIYITLVFLLPVLYLLNRCVVIMNAYLYAFISLIVASGSLFFLFPTTVPRDPYPIDELTDPYSRALLTWIRQIDHPTNCTPSLHVSIAFLGAFGFLGDRKEYFPALLLWAVLLAGSTLTTKQHSLFDVATGFIIAVGFYILFHRIFGYRFTFFKPAENDPA